MLQQEQPLQVARNTKIINADSDEPQYVINIKQIAKYVVKLGEKVSPTDIEEGMRVGVDRVKYQIQVRLCFCISLHLPFIVVSSAICYMLLASSQYSCLRDEFCTWCWSPPSSLKCADPAAAQD